ncbi:hypothetical protein Tco_1071196 [Tanacetum coccineum]|uniref:Uncharacterized protein n=1 Tax=Tanacetum coccineum TaxID=301880 RepID=A0ABQ5HPK8_9ASTR
MVTSAVAGGGDSQSDEDAEVELHCSAQCLIEDEDVVKRLRSPYTSVLGALMSMGRVFETHLRIRRVKQSGEIDIEFKTVNEYTVKVNEVKVIMSESA